MADDSVQRIVINAGYGGFGLSDAAYQKLIEYGVPVCGYGKEASDLTDGVVIFDRDLCTDPSPIDAAMCCLTGRYWDSWTRESRTHPLLIKVVEELGEAASGKCATLKIVEVPVGVKWEIDDYDGYETVEEVHRSWG